MRVTMSWGVRGITFLLIATMLVACGVLPGFGVLDNPTLYLLPVGRVANQVACELQEFVVEHEKDQPDSQHRWHLADEDINVRLTLTTDTRGNVNFTGVNLAKLGLETVASFITTQSKVPSLGIKVNGDRSKTVTVSFSVSPHPLPSSRLKVRYKDRKTHQPVTQNCEQNWRANNPITSLYLRDWLTNYFETINTVGSNQRPPPSDNFTDNVARVMRELATPEVVPEQFKIQSVDLSTQFALGVDVSGGATPNILGDGSVFIVPINGLSFDFNPTYQNRIEIIMNMCDSRATVANTCNANSPLLQTAYRPILDRQCQIYAYLAPLLSVKPPRDYEGKGKNCTGRCTCSKDQGIYIQKKPPMMMSTVPTVSPNLLPRE